ncbi:MAG TPA: DUF4157 domain-containing protein [Kofleriaceae bacterium]|nr:DUF4157 domain-containing protein [Kofleriaceae bacterium]
MLPPDVSTPMGALLGHDVSNVTVHQDGKADAMGTRAFAQGDALHFAAGAYQPESPAGLSLIGHELAHVAQQREGRVAPTGVAGGGATGGGIAVNTDPSLEAEAHATGAKVAQGFDLDGFLDFGGAARAGAVAAPVAQGEDLPAAPAPAAPAAAASAMPPEVMARVGAEFEHTADTSAKRSYRITPAGGFLMIASSTGRGVGVEFTKLTNEAAWTTLCTYVAANAATIPATVPAAPGTPTTGEQPAAEPGFFDDPLAAIGGAISGAVDGAINVGKAILGLPSDIINAALDLLIGEGPAPAEDAAPATGDPAAKDPAAGDGAAEEPIAPAPSGAALPGVFEVIDKCAWLRDGTGAQLTTKVELGTKVYILETRKNGSSQMAKIATPEGVTPAITADSDTWTSIANLGGKGEDVKTEVDGDLPPGRNPGTSPFKWGFGPGFLTSEDETVLDSSLWSKVQQLLSWAIQNDMVTSSITISSGCRGKPTAHRWCVAWEIVYNSNVTYDAVKALPGGKDADGTQWYQEGWTWEEVQANARAIGEADRGKPTNTAQNSKARAAGGYEKGDPKRAPLGNGAGVSKHVYGNAIDVSIPWRAPGKDASTGASDIWAWENIYAQFGLVRNLHKDVVKSGAEDWHIQEKPEAQATD